MKEVIKLPKFFDDKLNNTKFYDATLSTLRKITPLLDKQSALFPEYTDHSSSHIQDVLDSAANLITKTSYKKITAEDIYVLVLAICLHDSAMTFNWDDLKRVLTDPKYNGQVFGYDDHEEPDWQCLWKEFHREFCNFTQADLTDIIGDKIILGEKVSDYFPSIEEDDLKDSQLKVAGEFVRRHHARLAHVVANYGLPSIDKGELFTQEHAILNDLAGLVARSHHESLRAMYDRLDNSHKMSYLNCHLIFLMAIVRIADLMQITSDRTPLITFKSKTFWSSFSENEWKKHLSVLGIKDVNNDPNCLAFEIAPNLESVQRLHSIRSLLHYFQQELDLVWASLGEAYGESKLAVLKIKFRRVSSELDSPDFLKRLTFEDQPASFKVDLSLIKKLITPLYGNHPKVGIRELLQNGLDSVRERTHIDPSCNYKVRVKLYKTDDDSYIEISDDGCGMDSNTIKNYFLNIGASFRSSKQWASEFTIESKSTVNRSGRFGIGMLAGFILGDSIEVTTRKYTVGDKGKALNFSFTLDGRMIQIDRVPARTVEIGTVIKIKLKPNIDDHLRKNKREWKWYSQLDNDYQEVEYFIDNVCLENLNTTPVGYWNHVSSLNDTYRNFRWASNSQNSIYENMLFVNNLKISESADYSTSYTKTLDTYDQNSKQWGFDIEFPPVALEDPDLNLPLNLERNGFSDPNILFGETLYHEVITNYINSAESYTNKTLINQGYNLDVEEHTLKQLFYGLGRNNRSYGSSKPIISLWGMHENGFILSDLSLIQDAKVETIYIASRNVELTNIVKLLPKNSVVFKLKSSQFENKYRRGKLVLKEENILSYFKSNVFIDAMFGRESDIKVIEKNHTLIINNNTLDKINTSYEIKPEPHKKDINALFDKRLLELDIHSGLSLNHGEFIVSIDIKDIPLYSPKNLFSIRWLTELTSPFLNNETERKVFIK